MNHQNLKKTLENYLLTDGFEKKEIKNWMLTYQRMLEVLAISNVTPTAIIQNVLNLSNDLLLMPPRLKAQIMEMNDALIDYIAEDAYTALGDETE